MTEKKRHHFVPEAYLKSFCDHTGHIHAYRKDYPTTHFVTSPSGVGLRRYYYSQPTPEGGVDNNRLEDLFSTLETRWPPLVERMHRRDDVNNDLSTIFEFMALQRVRVPASRDVTEHKLAAFIKQSMLDLYALGKLPPIPPTLDSLDKVLVSIDPHKSIHGMVEDLRHVQQVFDRIGIVVVHNRTSLPFLTSDNPVIWFDPSIPDEAQRPYQVSQDGPILLLFPLSPTLLLMGTDEHKEMFVEKGLLYSESLSEDWVLRVNEAVCRYSYEAVYSQSPGLEDLIHLYAEIAPVYDPESDSMVFGIRKKMPKWEPKVQPKAK